MFAMGICTMSKKEFWKDVPNTNGFYEANTFGEIRVKHNKTLLKQRKRKDGYLLVNMYINKHKTTKYVHRVIATTFIPNIHNLSFVNHIDENKQNNNVKNLQWCTSKENNNHGTRGLRISKTLCKKVVQYDLNGNVVDVWDSIKEATGTLKIRNISQACRGLRKKAGGYKWRYFNERS